MTDQLITHVFEMKKELQNWRRDLHRFPERGWREVYTSAYIAGTLRAIGYDVKTGEAVCKSDKRLSLPSANDLEAHFQNVLRYTANHPDDRIDPADLYSARYGHTGVIGELCCGSGPVIALRFDMDALPITEERNDDHFPSRERFLSENPGTMHACGHDSHMAIGLGTARILASMKDMLHGTIRLIFQPAEEGVLGALSITQAGHLDDVDYLLAGHIMGSEDGSCYVTPGMEGTLATAKLRAVFHGRSAHASAAPEAGSNALLAAATALLNIHAMPRHSGGNSRVNVGALHGGSVSNIICDRAELLLEVRGDTSEVCDHLEQYARRILDSAAKMHDCRVSIETMGAAPTVSSSKEFSGYISDLCRNALSVSVHTPPLFGASEDYSFMTERVQEHGGKTCFIGIHVPTKAPLHNPLFDFDESALVMGTTVFAGTVCSLLRRMRSR